MAANIDPTLADILRKYGADPTKDVWNCHGTWVAYHRTLEKIAAAAKVTFDPPIVIEHDSSSGHVAICVTGRIDNRAEWSIGEAAPKNNKTAYPYAMAEKRAKDRVIIKLVGLHGLYSEDEADEFKSEEKPAQKPKTKAEEERSPFDAESNREAYIIMAEQVIDTFAGDAAALRAWWKDEADHRRVNKLTKSDVDDLSARAKARIGQLERPANLIMAG